MKVVGLGKMHILAKNGVNIRIFAMELAQIMVRWIESQVNSCLVPFFVKRFSLKPWYAMFGIFPRYSITYHDSMRRFSIFLIFFEFTLLQFQIQVKLMMPSMCARWVGLLLQVDVGANCPCAW
jgi:hypothetical protein